MEVQGAFGGLIQSLISVLPTSPFAPVLEQFEDLPFLGYLNWFFPVRGCLTVMAAWLVAVAAFYLFSVIARWVKLIGD